MLAGKLNWACRVFYDGRTFLRRILDQTNQLNSPNAKFKLNKDFYADLDWWLSFLSVFNGKRLFLDKLPTIDVQTDACTYGAGAYFHGDWYYHSFVMDTPEVRDLHINYKEVMAIVLAAKRWGHLWSNKHIVIQSDSTTAVSIINKGTSKNTVVMQHLRGLFWSSAIFNFRVTAIYIPGHMNCIADAISRLHEAHYLLKAYKFLLPHYGLLLLN